MAPRRHNIGASRRRRREDEGEDEGSIDGGLEDDSLSEGSVISHQDDEDADGEGSDESDDDASISPRIDSPSDHQTNGRVPETNQGSHRRHSTSPRKRLLAAPVSDTDTMMNGLKISDKVGKVPQIDFNNMKVELPQTQRTPSAPPTEPTRETLTERKRREQNQTPKERGDDPTFVPTRGSFFLHDKRSTEPGTNGHKAFSKPKSRPYGLIVDGNVRRHSAKPDVASEGPWTHDLHDTVAGDDSPPSKSLPVSSTASAFPPKPVPTAPRSSPPNRSFSSTTVIGNVPVVVSLPGMSSPIPFPAVLKKQHTRLPQHRPPLRRDKPVRISLPGQTPRYIFPATERSFIFIPRALRPNQQTYRGRGRGGFYGGRRPSIYASSTYTPSVTMSRRSSFGKAPSQEGYQSPAASVLSRQPVVTTENGKPVVRLPPPPRPLAVNPSASMVPGPVPSVMGPPLTQTQQPIWRESRPAPIPMHQPRPKKTVSVADIETPASFPINPPQPQQEQPFHHQVPMAGNGPVYGPDPSSTHPPPTQSSATPLSHIPERAVHAQPFHVYGYQQAQPFYPTAYPPGPVYYPVSGTDYPPYSTAGAGPGTSVPPYPGQNVPYMVPAPHTSGEPPGQPGTVAHEAGGTVYYYDASQMYPASSFGVPAGGVVGMGGMMTPPGTTYYYPQPQGVYYAS